MFSLKLFFVSYVTKGFVVRVLRVLLVLWVDLTDHQGLMEAPHRTVPQAHLDLLHLWDLTILGLTTRDLQDHSKSFNLCVIRHYDLGI